MRTYIGIDDVPSPESIFLYTPTYGMRFLTGDTSRVFQGISRGVSKRRRRRRRKRRRSGKQYLSAWSREGCMVDRPKKSERQSDRDRKR